MLFMNEVELASAVATVETSGDEVPVDRSAAVLDAKREASK
jgi:hypothetical protein